MQRIRDIWNHRGLILTLASTDLRLRYKNSVLGFFWSFLEPLLSLTVLYFVFTNILKSPIENYALYLFLGIIMWNMFSRGTTMGMNSLLNKSGIISKIRIPREIFVISATITSFYMMLFEFIIFTIFAVINNLIPNGSIIFIIPMLITLFVLTLGASFGLSVLLVRYRDLQSIWSVLLQAGFWLAPIVYTTKVFPTNIAKIISINPFAPIIEITHNAVLYGILPTSFHFIQVMGETILIFIIGYAIFWRLDKKIVEEF